eukprot:TRINITY_DN1317_c0_g1_i1.p1 TRINITY_DN1317_c0_g1~~TRINITY_DN1317_c0_g1_i1.p1  ORF type:complete len:1262 (-),score=481.25 TRINITY_DN1317_c0_g1_i1:205-3990(-)
MGAGESKPATGASFDELVPGATWASVSAEDSKASERRNFALPKGWKVVCRLSPSDPRARWGSRPRPTAAAGATNAANAASGAGSGSAKGGLEAELLAPELRQPLKVPLQLLPVWVEPKVGELYLDRFEVQKALPKSLCEGGEIAYRVVDTRASGADRILRILDGGKEADTRSLAERLQLECLDSNGQYFMKLHDIWVSLQPGRVAAVEDAVRCTLWQEFQRLKPGKELATKVGEVASASLTGLSRLHANGWAHCGVTPHTVVLCQQGLWKLSGLASARRVRELANFPLARLGTAPSPEVLLGLRISEKVDVWQLGATLSEAIMRSRLDVVEEQKPKKGHEKGVADISMALCRLIEFVGPLPSNLVASHPSRELFFTPEGHVLRPVTPDAKGNVGIEAIEPAAAAAEKTASGTPRPAVLSNYLGDSEGSDEVLEFLGRLLIPDPDQRPSVGEALAHHFLRKIWAKAVGFEQMEETKEEEAGKKPADSAEKKSPLARKGTGFVHAGELPASDDEEEEEEDDSAAKKKGGHVHIVDNNDNKGEKKHDKEVCQSKLARKGTGFVHAGELPPSDDEDEEEEEPAAKPAGQGGQKAVVIKDDKPQDKAAAAGGQAAAGSKLARKGTGFVHAGELPPSDDEEEEEDGAPAKTPPKKDGHVHIVADKEDKGDDKGQCQSKLARKGTGFVHAGELPPSDDEDEEEEDTSQAQKAKDGSRVHIQDSKEDKSHEKGQAQSKLARKGTGFVHAGELPPSDDEDEEEEETPAKAKAKDGRVHIAEDVKDKTHDKEAGGGAQSKLARKGTGFVHMGELPPSDDEDEDEEEGAPKKPPVKDGHVHIQDDKADTSHEKGANPQSKLARKGTGFVHSGELPPSDDEDEEEEEAAPKKKDGHVKINDSKEDAGSKEKGQSTLARKGTGFVHMGELPPSDDEDDEEEEEQKPAKAGSSKVRIDEDAKDKSHEKGAAESKLARKGTGFVHVGELPPSDDEDEEEDEAPKKPSGSSKVKIDDKKGDGGGADAGSKLARKGTGFVHMGELPPSDDEDEEEDETAPAAAKKDGHVHINDDKQDGGADKQQGQSKLARKGTGFVHAGELPPSDDEDEEEDESAPAKKAAGSKVQIAADAKDKSHDKETSQTPLARKGTGFVHMGELPPSDDEDDEEEEAAPAKAGKVTIKDDGGGGGGGGGEAAKPLARKGTGFVHMGELPPSDDEDEDEEEAPKNRKVQLKDDEEVAKKGGAGGGEKGGSSLGRKGTGFVSAADLPDSDEEEED